MRVTNVSGAVSPFRNQHCSFSTLRGEIEQFCGSGSLPLRVAITETDTDRWSCEVDAITRDAEDAIPDAPSVFAFRRRTIARTSSFNTVMLVPTGIDCAVGGHAGDATPAARLLASISDTLILHPNVVNASDINEQPENCLYVEGSLICRLLMGSISLRRVRSNRILLVTEEREDGSWAVDQVVNTASAARATLGVDVNVIVLRRPLSVRMARSKSGRSVGEIDAFGSLFRMLADERPNYDAVALSTKITPPAEAVDLLREYYDGEGPNPWGGVEAALTHAVSFALDVPSAHAPTIEELELLNFAYGRVDPRKAAEAISTSYTFCILKGLRNAPAVVSEPTGVFDPTIVAAEDISCVVIPAGVVGLPTLAALAQGINVIAVRENTNVMRNDLASLPFANGQLWVVDNYLEAAGVVAALRAGVHPAAVRRPLAPTRVTHY
jgi:hypothetical protein